LKLVKSELPNPVFPLSRFHDGDCMGCLILAQFWRPADCWQQPLLPPLPQIELEGLMV